MQRAYTIHEVVQRASKFDQTSQVTLMMGNDAIMKVSFTKSIIPLDCKYDHFLGDSPFKDN